MNALASEVTPGVRRFPEGFLWGCGTSAYQIEGAVDEDGRGQSIWDVFSHTGGKVHRGDTGDIACDSYHQGGRDLELLTDLGVSAYRFSIAWPRVQPEGTAPSISADWTTTADWSTNCAAARSSQSPRSTTGTFRRRSSSAAAGPSVTPHIGSPTTPRCSHMRSAIGVGMWVTINEPSQIVGQGYREGTHAPGHHDDAEAARATHHILLGHGLAVQALRSALPAAKVGIALDPHPYLAAEPAAEPVVAAIDADRNRMYLDPVFHGFYPQGCGRSPASARRADPGR